MTLLADIGSRHNIGGQSGRGGLLVKARQGRMHALQYLSVIKNGVDTVNALIQRQPSFFKKSDVKRYALIQCAVRNECLEMVRYFCEVD